LCSQLSVPVDQGPFDQQGLELFFKSTVSASHLTASPPLSVFKSSKFPDKSYLTSLARNGELIGPYGMVLMVMVVVPILKCRVSLKDPLTEHQVQVPLLSSFPSRKDAGLEKKGCWKWLGEEDKKVINLCHFYSRLGRVPDNLQVNWG